jgi:hypothetical protein
MLPREPFAGRASVAAGITLAGCLGGATSEPPMLSAREQWTNTAWPALSTCAGCHGAQPAIDFLAPNTADGAYETVFEFQPPVIDVEVPASSLLLTMGKHTGPPLGSGAASAVLAWLGAERDERVPDIGEGVRVGPFIPTIGAPMTFDLGVAGATIEMVPEASEAGLYVSRLTLKAGTGLHVVHPLFVSRPPHPIVDAVDRFSELDMVLAPNATVELGPAWFLAFDPTEYLSIHFSALEAP